ncbi:MAG: undecaprenyldiphospho-muramoylpentapeptide beta-N-acetylglucosaminyltransferase [Candidatus Gastranaerophilales bacterium]|nr:undecaprenyldiphospho-muramoylpentapeptide beta-N-acetylglucosaminyltransferase [Candidatus Gastranaerophilales bacterium]
MQQTQSDNKKVYFISGGGTGGHIYPAVSIAETLLQQEDTGKIYYIGNPDNLEKNIVKQNPELEFLPVKVSGMPRKCSFKFLKWFWDLKIATLKAVFYIKKYKPSAVFTTGGYVSAPAAIAAILTKTPFMIHDCDAQPGLVSKLVAPYADKVSVAFEGSKKLLKSDKIEVNGNPIRSSFCNLSKTEARAKLSLRNKVTILAMGGSQGARTINNAVIEMAQAVTEELDVQLIIQTGKKNFDDVIKRFEEYFPNYYMNTNLVIRPYFDEMWVALNSADIVISRAGSLSLSEINLCGLPSILVPYPYAAADHQKKNAKAMEEKGASVCLEDKDCSRDNLLNIVKEIIFNSDKMSNMSHAAYLMATPDAAVSITKQLKSIIK